MEKKFYNFQEIKQKLVNYCVYQDRCHAEVEEKMNEFVLIPEAKDELYQYLIQENYLNEERYVRSYIRGKFYIKKWGRSKIKSNLKFKGISEKLIIKCYDEIHDQDYRNTLEQLWNNYYENKKALKEYQKKSKTITYLLSRGYEYEEILKMLHEEK